MHVVWDSRPLKSPLLKQQGRTWRGPRQFSPQFQPKNEWGYKKKETHTKSKKIKNTELKENN